MYERIKMNRYLFTWQLILITTAVFGLCNGTLIVSDWRSDVSVIWGLCVILTALFGFSKI